MASYLSLSGRPGIAWANRRTFRGVLLDAAARDSSDVRLLTVTHDRPVSTVIRLVALFLTLVAATGAEEIAITPQVPTVPGQAFRADPQTGALMPLEFTKARKEGYGKVYCYLEGAQSTVTIQQGEPLVFVGRLDGSPKYLENYRKAIPVMFRLEFLFVSKDGKRYATRKYVPMEGGPYGEVIPGVSPKNPKDVGQAFTARPVGQLPPGEYALTGFGMSIGTYPYPGCEKVVAAFSIVEGAPKAQPKPPAASSLPATQTPAAPTQSPAAPTNSAADLERLGKAAEQGDVAAQIGMARAYATGNGVPQDYQRTNQWLRKAVDQGSAEAQYWLAVMYRDAVGVPPDQAQAAELFRKAAEQGNALAQGNLGNLHFFGRGVVQDYVEAHKWFNLAAARLDGEDRKQCAELRDKVAALMTPAQLAEAQKRAAEWFEAFQKRKP